GEAHCLNRDYVSTPWISSPSDGARVNSAPSLTIVTGFRLPHAAKLKLFYHTVGENPLLCRRFFTHCSMLCFPVKLGRDHYALGQDSLDLQLQSQRDGAVVPITAL